MKRPETGRGTGFWVEKEAWAGISHSQEHTFTVWLCSLIGPREGVQSGGVDLVGRGSLVRHVMFPDRWSVSPWPTLVRRPEEGGFF